jgi:hypothetical protein
MRLPLKELFEPHLKALASTARAHRRWLIVLAIIVIAVLAILIYRREEAKRKTYYVAYIGKYMNPSFERLHELAIEKYLNELNAELPKVRLELKRYRLDEYGNDPDKIYQGFIRQADTVLVIDNGWGSDFQKANNTIRSESIPVININSDKSLADYGNNVMFLGHDDEVPRKVITFCKQILQNDTAVFIPELDYPLTKAYRTEFTSGPNKMEITEIPVSTYEPNENDRENLLNKLDSRLKELQAGGNHKKPIVVLNVHRKWGDEIISHIEKDFRDVVIIGGSYIMNGKLYEGKHGKFDQSNKGNSLIMLNAPADAVSQKVYDDFNSLKMIKGEDPTLFDDIKARLYVKRCLDAVSLLRGALLAREEKLGAPTISQADFIAFFHSHVDREYVSNETELYEFDNNLKLSDERPFELRSRGRITSYPTQLEYSKESGGQLIPVSNVYFGIEMINVSNIDVAKKSFHADFFYWIKGHSDDPKIDSYIQFRNEIKQSGEKDIPLPNETAAPLYYKLYKKSADFNMNVDFANYPFDSQELRIEVEVIGANNRVVISFDNSDFENSKRKVAKLNFDEWKMKDFYITVDNSVTTSFRGSLISENQSPQKFKTLNVRLPIARDSTVPFVTIILPLIMIGLAAIAILFIKDNSFGHIGEVCVGIFLSIVTYSIGFAQLTPRSNVLTIADMLFYGTFFLVLLIFLKVILLNSSLLNENMKNWLTSRTILTGLVAFIGYGSLILAIIVYAKSK